MIDETNPINIGKAQPPIAFAASNPEFRSKFPDGSDELWSVHIKAVRQGIFCEVFEDIFFVESSTGDQGTAHIFGIEFEDGYPKGFNAAWADKQQAFIQFLLDENAKDDEALGWTRKLFTGHEYACVGKATAAYLATRDRKLNMGVGYRNNDGEYELAAVDSEDWIQNARATLPFDELGND